MRKTFILLAVATVTGAFAQKHEDCPPIYANPYTDCATGITYLNAAPGFDAYNWSPPADVSNPFIANPYTTIAGSYTVTGVTYLGPELLTNGDFSAGNTGFFSAMNYSTTYTPGNYYVGPGWFSPTLDPTKPDVTPSTDNMFMAIDGASTPTIIWEETIAISPGTDYTFSFYGTRAAAAQPIYEIHFIGDVSGDNVVATITGFDDPTYAAWIFDQYNVCCWNSGNDTKLTISIINLETAGYGNDFAMDDFSFRESCCTSYVVSAPTSTNVNLFTNYDFSAGNTGFLSGMTYSTIYTPGNYYVGPGWFSPVLDPNLPDVTPTSDNMFMAIDGASPATMIWEQTVPVTPGSVYQFSFWATEAYAAQPNFEIHFIGDVTGDVIVSTQAGYPAPTGTSWIWDQYGVACWDAGNNTTVTVRIINLETAGYGNDFAMDDFEFRECCDRDACCDRVFGQGRMAVKESVGRFEVYPNPGDGSFRIDMPQASDKVQVEIFSLVGVRIDAFTFSGAAYNYAPEKPLVPGTYILRVNAGTEQYTRRIMVK